MKPFIKWQGGKRRELKHIRDFIPSAVPIAEPFCGGAAVSFDSERTSFLNDTNKRLFNLYNVVSSADGFARLQEDVNTLRSIGKSELSDRYYLARSNLNTHPLNVDSYQSALDFLILRQLAFSGMERYNSKGEFNVPFGRYEKFSCSLDRCHHEFLANSHLTSCDALDFINTLPDDVWLFLDPPYLERAGYEQKDGGIHLHAELSIALHKTKNPFLLIHSDHEFYRHAYKDFNIKEVPFKYAQQFNGGNYKSEVVHHYITNY